MAIAGFVLGLVSCFLGKWVGIVVSILAIVFSSVGLKEKTKRKGFAVAGLILGIISCVYSVLTVTILPTILKLILDQIPEILK